MNDKTGNIMQTAVFFSGHFPSVDYSLSLSSKFRYLKKARQKFQVAEMEAVFTFHKSWNLIPVLPFTPVIPKSAWFSKQEQTGGLSQVHGSRTAFLQVDKLLLVEHCLSSHLPPQPQQEEQDFRESISGCQGRRRLQLEMCASCAEVLKSLETLCWIHPMA